MENASKALIMAAEILIGIMIISIGVYIFNEMGKYSADTTAQLEAAQLAQYNNQFLKYYGSEEDDDGNVVPIKCTIHEVIGIANLAQKTNTQNGFEGEQTPTDTSAYIQIDVKTDSGNFTHLENIEESELINILKNNSLIYTSDNKDTEKIYFKVSEIGIAEKYGVVNYMKFIPYN